MRSGDLWAPMVPVPKGNAQEIYRRGRHLGVKPRAKVKRAQAALAVLLRASAGSRECISGPVWRDACYVLPIPPSWPRWKRVAAEELRYLPPGGGRQPDTGNLTKLLDDALEDAGLIANDGQIVGGCCVKLYGAEPGYIVRLTELPQASRTEPAWPFIRPPLTPPVRKPADVNETSADLEPHGGITLTR